MPIIDPIDDSQIPVKQRKRLDFTVVQNSPVGTNKASEEYINPDDLFLLVHSKMSYLILSTVYRR